MAGSRPARSGPPDWDAIRLSYETTTRSIRSIAAEHGVAASTLRRRRKQESWRPRPDCKHTERPAAAPRGKGRPQSLVSRLYAILDHTLELMEQRMTSGEPPTAAERERESRALSTLARAVGQISELNPDPISPKPAARPGAGSDSDERRETDRLRLELARRLVKLRERRERR